MNARLHATDSTRRGYFTHNPGALAAINATAAGRISSEPYFTPVKTLVEGRLFDRLDRQCAVVERGVNCDLLTSMVLQHVRIGNRIHLAVDDKHSRRSAFNALLGARRVISAGHFGRILRTHGVRNPSGK